jgi:polyisoprenoid-binding protein YceI
MASTQELLSNPASVGVWNIDQGQSTIGFKAKSMWGLASVKGRFKDFSGDGQITDAQTVFGRIDIKADSLDTGIRKRDEHLRSADFFGAEANPELRFESTAIRPLDDDTFEIDGRLTMNGVTNPVTLTAVVLGTETDPWGNERVGIEVTGQVKRGDWNMTFNQALGSGNLLVGEKVTLGLDISAVKQG